jgi:hypothetical protein
MKTTYRTILFVFFLAGNSVMMYAQNVGINTTGAAPDNSALLDLNASPGNNKGFLVPRMTGAQMAAITTPADALLVFNTDCQVFEYWNGTSWIAIGNASGISTPGAITGNSSVCVGSTGNTYSISAVSGATSYNWTVPTGTTLVSGQGTTSITVNFPTAVSGNICVTANNTCGTSLPSCLAVVAAGYVSGSQTFTFTGAVQTFTVPCGVTTFTVDLRGGQGGYDASFPTSGGYGGRVVTTITGVTPGQVIDVYVGGRGGLSGTGASGGAGWPNGGSGGYFDYTGIGLFFGGGGGGSSDIRVSPYGVGNIIAIAGGGGGCGQGPGAIYYSNGGAGGDPGTNGSNGGVAGGGTGATQIAGGTGGANDGGASGGNGSSFSGGYGGYTATLEYGAGGGGGGGYYGGGGGGADGNGNYTGGAGGGGSSWTSGSSTTYTTGYSGTNSEVIISW